MLANQAVAGPVDRTAPSTVPSWENPGADAAARQETSAPAQLPLLEILRKNARRIASLAFVLSLVCLAIILIIPARYAATALVLVDPREQKVTNEQDVLPGIGQDTAALQSVVEIAQSDGFLRPLIEKLNVAADPEIAGGETNVSQVLARFRSRLDISRRGLTYVIAITFQSSDPARAAYYANAIAEAFVASQARTRALATEEAAGWLNNRLKALREQLTTSENAIAAFKSQHRIVDAGKDSTTRQLRVGELSQQLAAAKARTEDARTRYQQAQRDLRGNVDTSASSRSDLLTQLRAQRTLLGDQIAQKRAVFGDRHPDLVISYNQMEELGRQIEAERQRIVQAARSDFEGARSLQKHVEDLLNGVENESLATAQASVKLQDLQREADANRSIYEQFLGRYKTTNEQRSLQSSQTQIVSLASAPLRSTRPPFLLLALVTVVLSLLVSAASIVFLGMRGIEPSLPAIRPQTVKPPEKEVARETATALVPKQAAPDLPVWAVVPDLNFGPGQGKDQDLKAALAQFLETVALTRGLRGRVVLVLSIDQNQDNTFITNALSSLAIDRGMLSVLIRVAPSRQAAGANVVSAASFSRTGANIVLTTLVSLKSLMSQAGASPRDGADFRSEFDVVVVDATSIVDFREIAGVADYVDFACVIVRPSDSGERVSNAVTTLASNRRIRSGAFVVD